MKIIKIYNKHPSRDVVADESSIMSRFSSEAWLGIRFEGETKKSFCISVKIPTCCSCSQKHLSSQSLQLLLSSDSLRRWLKSTNISRSCLVRRYTSGWVVMAISVINFQHRTRKCSQHFAVFINSRQTVNWMVLSLQKWKSLKSRRLFLKKREIV
jgi:hypothetical protein